MKKIYQLIVLLSFLVALISISSCGGGETPKPDVFSLLQSGTWKIQSVTVDGANASGDFNGLTITFSSTGFTAANGEPVWPTSGTWTKNVDGNSINRGDGLTISIDKATESNLVLSLNWNKNTLGSGRLSSISGQHIFTFKK